MNILAKMLDMLTGAYNKVDQRNAEKRLALESLTGRLFAVVSWGFETIQGNAEMVRLWASIDHAAGAALDRHGKNYGVARGGSSDFFYRLLIKIKLLAQLSGGDIDTILDAVASLYDIDGEKVELYEIFPAKIQINIAENDLPEGYEEIRDIVGALTKRLLVAGVGIDMIYKSEDAAAGGLYIGGYPVAEYSRVRLDNYDEEPPNLFGAMYIAGAVVAEASRARLESEEI